MSEETRIKLGRFIREQGIRLKYKPIDERPDRSDFGPGAHHYKVVLYTDKGRLRLYYSMGSLLAPKPKTREVLSSLADDAAAIENAQSFADWAGELGYDPDSRKAERTYRRVSRAAGDLKAILGDDAFEQLLWHTERD